LISIAPRGFLRYEGHDQQQVAKCATSGQTKKASVEGLLIADQMQEAK
jgi:hypothetical protein